MRALLSDRLLATVPGFIGNQSALNPVGEGAARIEHHFAVIFWITSTVYLLTLLVLVITVWRRRYSLQTIPLPQQTTEESDRFAVRAVAGAMVLTIALLFVMLISSFRTSHAMGRMNSAQALEIDVIGHQWWWEVRYPNSESDKIVTTANEIHVPVGVRVRIHGTSTDVIHSFWAPNVQGKRDFMPGYDTDIVMQVDKPGRWRGQCAEFCGLQHAHMSFYMVAESADSFKQWLAQGAQSAVAPSNPELVHGQQVFLSSSCVMCHAIGSTISGGRVGPDLTHLARRATIAAGALPNDAEHLSAWILNPQQTKPGSRMPPNQISGADMHDLVAYLGSLR
jgi:cytochrome c oxidase subunit 2